MGAKCLYIDMINQQAVPPSCNCGRCTSDFSPSLHFYAIFPILQQSPCMEHVITARDLVYNLCTIPLRRSIISNGAMCRKDRQLQVFKRMLITSWYRAHLCDQLIKDKHRARWEAPLEIYCGKTCINIHA